MKKPIYCERCNNREGFGKSFERINYKNNIFHLCVECSQIAYKIKDALADGDSSRVGDLVLEFSSLPKIPSEVLTNWFGDYKTRLGIPQITSDRTE